MTVSGLSLLLCFAADQCRCLTLLHTDQVDCRVGMGHRILICASGRASAARCCYQKTLQNLLFTEQNFKYCHCVALAAELGAEQVDELQLRGAVLKLCRTLFLLSKSGITAVVSLTADRCAEQVMLFPESLRNPLSKNLLTAIASPLAAEP